MVPTLLSNEHGRVLSGSLNWKLYLWLPRGMMGTPPSTSFLSVDNSLHNYIMILYIHKILCCVIKLMEAIFHGVLKVSLRCIFVCTCIIYEDCFSKFVVCCLFVGEWYLRNPRKLSHREF